eukprot:CAMPEP_0178765792 /NCGR_PEP_ID=MMETSP0744-20121128/18666_1 /TAXON_ID=913974 /ORGANISM="Nitzschia punctata, Strain CCMP561" /LENGTH=56 /DNA_ID=CAMNT_0020421363 /DNA_START=560 /DNA_END=730 /DNA_ORIENTATION=-
MQVKKRRKESVVLEDEKEKDIEQEEKGEKDKVEDASIIACSAAPEVRLLGTILGPW